MGEPISNTFTSFSEEEPKENKDINLSEIETDEILITENIEKTTVESVANIHIAEKEEEKQIDTKESSQKESIVNPELTLIKDLISDLSAQFESKIKYDKHKEEIKGENLYFGQNLCLL